MSNILLIHLLMSLIILFNNITIILSNDIIIANTTISQNQHNITCDQSQSSCNISCNAENACSTNIICPLNNCDLCTINCNRIDSCSNANIITGQCKTVHLNINKDTDNLIISSPDDTGSLYMNIDENVQHFDQSTINSKSNTNNIVIDCNGDCSENVINALDMNGNLNFSCIGNCDSNTIHCPNSCNIDCNDCIDTQIKANNDINWQCNENCANSSIIVNGNTLKSWQECSSSEWRLLNINDECDKIVLGDNINSTNATSPDSDGDLNQFTILAFVLIGTVIGCLCVIVVTTIICCICWHEHQIKAINMKPTDSDNVHHLEQAENIQRDRTTPSPPGSSTEPSPNSITGRDTLGTIQAQKQPIIGYIPTKSQSPESNAVNASPHKRKKSGTKKPIIYQQTQQTNVAYAADDNDDNQDRYNRKMSQNQKQKRKQSSNSSQQQQQRQNNNKNTRRGSKKKKGHTKTGSQSVTTTTTHNSNMSYQTGIGTNISSKTTDQSKISAISKRGGRKSTYDDKVSSQQTPQNNNGYIAPNKNGGIGSKPIKKKRKVTFDEANNDEAKDGLAPLKNDVYGSKFDEHGNYNKFAGRQQNKEDIRMQLEAFPSNISGGTTRTEEMNFVGSNYKQYNPNDQVNSYFKEDYEHAPINGGYASDNLSLGNLDSGTTIASSIAPSSIAPSSIAMGPVTPTIDAAKQQQRQQVQHQYQGQHQHQHQHQHRKPNNIKIIKPQNAGKVRAKQHRNNNHNNNSGDDQSPTLTYTSGHDPPISHEDGDYYNPGINTPDSPDTNQGYRD